MSEAVRTIRVEHLGRVEGHGGITVELAGQEVAAVRFDVFEGLRLLEGLVRGHRWDELPQMVSRICSICSTAHALVAAEAIEDAFGVQVTPQTDLLRDVLLAGENIESHALHLFLLAAPDYLGYPSAPAMAADLREAVQLGLRLKQLGNRIQEVLGGRAIHPVKVVPGGFSAPPVERELQALREALDRAAADAQAALAFARDLPRVDICRGETAYAALAPASGYGYRHGRAVVFLHEGSRRAVPLEDFPALVREHAVPHSHAKHASYLGEPFMVGALARLALFGDRLEAAGRDASATLGLAHPSEDPLDNNLAQAVELVRDVAASRQALDRLLAEGVRDERPLPVVPRAGSGTAVIEAPRGLLLHRYTFDADGVTTGAEVITPTALNASSVEERFRVLVEADPLAEDAELRARLEMVARAYDPCISCSVHLVRRRAGDLGTRRSPPG